MNSTISNTKTVYISLSEVALTGDLTLLNGEVTAIDHADPSGQPVAMVSVVMTNQNDEVMASGEAEVRLPTDTLPAE